MAHAGHPGQQQRLPVLPAYGGPTHNSRPMPAFKGNPQRGPQPRQAHPGGRMHRRGAGRRGGPRHFSRHPDALGSLPVPPGALSDPWEALNAQHGGFQPLEVPNKEILAELKREVARQIRLQHLLSVREAFTENWLDAEEAVAAAKETELKQRDSKDESRSGGEKSCPPGASEGNPCVSEMHAVRCGKPLVLPPVSLEGEAQGEEAQGPESSRSGIGDSDRGNLSVLLEAPAARARQFQLPAATGKASDGLQGRALLCLDEEGIKKKLRAEAAAPGEDRDP